MPVKRLFVNQPMFAGAHVMQVDYPYEGKCELEYSKLRGKLCREINGTWGYTGSLIATRVTNFNKDDYFSGQIFRGYMIFKDEIDILHIRLKYDQNFKSVKIWPAYLTFNIHEFVDDDA